MKDPAEIINDMLTRINQTQITGINMIELMSYMVHSLLDLNTAIADTRSGTDTQADAGETAATGQETEAQDDHHAE